MRNGHIGGQNFIDKLFEDVQRHVLALACDEVVVVAVPAPPTGYLTVAPLVDGAPSASQYSIQKPPGMSFAPGDYAACIRLAKIRFIVAKVPKTVDTVARFDLPLAAPSQNLIQLANFSQDAADTASTTNTATYVQAMTMNVTLPDTVGQYNVRVFATMRLSNGGSASVNMRVLVGASTSAARTITSTTALALMATSTTLGTFTGGTTQAVTLQYKGTAGTTSADQPSFIIDAIRIS